MNEFEALYTVDIQIDAPFLPLVDADNVRAAVSATLQTQGVPRAEARHEGCVSQWELL